MSSNNPKPDSSLARRAATSTPEPDNSAPTMSAMARAATAAVPCPMTMIRRGDATVAGRTPSSTTSRRPGSPTNRPRSVLANEPGDSLISLSRKCG